MVVVWYEPSRLDIAIVSKRTIRNSTLAHTLVNSIRTTAQLPPILQSPMASSSSWMTYIQMFWYLHKAQKRRRSDTAVTKVHGSGEVGSQLSTETAQFVRMRKRKRISYSSYRFVYGVPSHITVISIFTCRHAAHPVSVLTLRHVFTAVLSSRLAAGPTSQNVMHTTNRSIRIKNQFNPNQFNR